CTRRRPERKDRPASLPPERSPLPLPSREDPRPAEDPAVGDSLSTCCEPDRIPFVRNRHLSAQANPEPAPPRSEMQHPQKQNLLRRNSSKWSFRWRDLSQEHLHWRSVERSFAWEQFAQIAAA